MRAGIYIRLGKLVNFCGIYEDNNINAIKMTVIDIQTVKRIKFVLFVKNN